jgi:NAD(P)-dependent dehydrogenase (short-subunit alcohol dehydrogenase family)
MSAPSTKTSSTGTSPSTSRRLRCWPRPWQPVFPGWREGLIVNIIDQRVWKLTPRFFSYTLSKAALWTATQTMAQALAPRIRVNAIGPGPTLANERQKNSDFARQAAAVPLERGPELSEFGATIRYLHGARSVTGQMIALDGGQHLAWETPDVTALGNRLSSALDKPCCHDARCHELRRTLSCPHGAGS